MDEAARGRVGELIQQIRRTPVFAGPQVLRVSAAEQRSAVRRTAQRLAEGSDRGDIVRAGHSTVRELLMSPNAHFHVGMYYGPSVDPSSARDRVEIALALEYLVLATTVEDLIGSDEYAALATDGANLLLDIPNRSVFPSVSYAPAPTAHGSSSSSIRVTQITVVAVLIVVSLVVAALVGVVPGLIGGCLAASIVASRMWRPIDDESSSTGDAPQPEAE